MYELMILIIGALGGFGLHTITMMFSFKQRTIDNKIKVFDSLIRSWVNMRNFIIAQNMGKPISQKVRDKFDEIYGNSQQLIGESILVCEDESLTRDINDLNESIYRNNWESLDSNEINETLNQFKIDVLTLVVRMRKDIKNNNRLEWKDLTFGISGLCPKRIKNKIPNNLWHNLKSKLYWKRPKKEKKIPERD
ncbi:MAG: hypothetical protein E2O80_07890 [Betaproteobacteria bacterium]|nr:MAG: hypothetical protein E2O80_07890 [Betaproteobacteria bacterium]